MRDLDLLFIIIALFNTNLGMQNSGKNEAQAEKLEQIDQKLNKIMEAMHIE